MWECIGCNKLDVCLYSMYVFCVCVCVCVFIECVHIIAHHSRALFTNAYKHMFAGLHKGETVHMYVKRVSD